MIVLLEMLKSGRQGLSKVVNGGVLALISSFLLLLLPVHREVSSVPLCSHL